MSLFTFGKGIITIIINFHLISEMELVGLKDPSKWFISILSLVGFTKNLRRTKNI